MRTLLIYTALLALGCLPAAARAGTVADGTDVAGNSPWTVEETWTNGSATLDLKISGTGTVSADLLAILQNFIASLPAAGWEPESGSTTTTATTTTLPAAPSVASSTGTSGVASSADASCPPIAPVPEPSGVALALSGVTLLVLALRCRARRS